MHTTNSTKEKNKLDLFIDGINRKLKQIET